MSLRLLLIFALLCLGPFGFEASSQQTKFHGEDTLTKVFTPRIQVGMGQLAYFGELQSNQKGFSPLVQRMAGHIEVTAPITNYFRLGFFGMFGRISANERTLSRNLNFNARIRMGGAMLYYTFYPLMGRHSKFLEPEFGVGISSFEFLSKTDMYDANGNMYHYWSDGSIMSLAENDPSASSAVQLYRDYTYETDLRELNQDGLGHYREQAWAIPLHLGFNFHIARRVNLNIGTTWYWTTSDLLDGFSKKGAGTRQGNKGNDMMLYTSLSLSYDLRMTMEKEALSIPQARAEDMLAILDSTDSDLDGVIDAFDLCANTPPEAYVGLNGCPIDSDDDGIPDYLDYELLSTPGVPVDELGVAMTDEELALIYKRFRDSTGEYAIYDQRHIEIRTNKITVILTPKESVGGQVSNKKYVVIVGKEVKEIGSNELSQYLGYRDFEAVESGDTVYYVMGKFDNFDDAVKQKIALEKDGVVVQAIGKGSEEEGMDLVNTVAVERTEERLQQSGDADSFMVESITQYRVQIGAFSKQPDKRVFSNVPDMVSVQGNDGLIRYYSGRYDRHDDAVKAMINLRSNGFPGAFVTAYKEGRRVTLAEAGVEVTETYDADREKRQIQVETGDQQSSQPEISTEDISFKVLLAEYEGELPTEMVNLFLELGGVQSVKEDDGMTRYYTKEVKTPEELEAKLAEIRALGLEDVRPIGLNKGQQMDYEQAVEYFKK